MGKADEEFMGAEEYGRSLKGLGINLLVKDVPRSVAFAKDVLGATVVFAGLFCDQSMNTFPERCAFAMFATTRLGISFASRRASGDAKMRLPCEACPPSPAAFGSDLSPRGRGEGVCACGTAGRAPSPRCGEG